MLPVSGTTAWNQTDYSYEIAENGSSIIISVPRVENVVRYEILRDGMTIAAALNENDLDGSSRWKVGSKLYLHVCRDIVHFHLQVRVGSLGNGTFNLAPKLTFRNHDGSLENVTGDLFQVRTGKIAIVTCQRHLFVYLIKVRW